MSFGRFISIASDINAQVVDINPTPDQTGEVYTSTLEPYANTYKTYENLLNQCQNLKFVEMNLRETNLTN